MNNTFLHSMVILQLLKEAEMSFTIYDYLNESSKYLPHSKKISRIKFEKGKYIYSPTVTCHSVFEVIQGAVKTGIYSSEGTEIVCDISLPGDSFGKLHSANSDITEFAKAISNVELYSYNVFFFKSLLNTDRVVSDWFQLSRTKRWTKIEKRLFSFYSEDISKRIIELAKNLTEVKVSDEEKEVNLLELLTQQDIAQLTNTTRQKVSQVLKEYAPCQ